MTEPRIRIAIVDDHALVRSGLRRLLELEDEIEVVGEASSAPEAIALVKQTKPDVLLLDLQMPGTSGLAAMSGIREASPGTRVLVVTMHDDAVHARSARSAGAAGYVVKSAAPADLVAAVRGVHAEELHFDPELTSKLPSEEGTKPGLGLSRRERQVLAGLVRGHTNREIADQLGVGVKSVESYRARLRAKLGADTRADLVKIAGEAGLLPE